jgi:hypothetical protein
MGVGELLGLSVRVWASTREDLAIIYAEPAEDDLLNLVRDGNLLDIVQVLVFNAFYHDQSIRDKFW